MKIFMGSELNVGINENLSISLERFYVQKPSRSSFVSKLNGNGIECWNQ